MDKMKISNKKTAESIVSKAYNKMALQYTRVFRKNSNYIPILKKVIKNIPKDAKILDAGCGTGVPVSKFLSKRFDVIGIDISSRMIKLARKNVPTSKFRLMSMTNLKFKPKSFDMICSFFALFHVKKDEIPKVIRKFNILLKDMGYLVLAVGEAKKDEEKLSTFFREPIYYSATSEGKLVKILRKHKFRIIFCKYMKHKYRKLGKNFRDNELFIIAQKSKNNEVGGVNIR